MEIKLSRQAIKFLSKLDEGRRNQLKQAIIGLTMKPPQGDIKMLKGIKNEYRLRVGKYRVIYSYDVENTLEILLVLKIGTRGDIYK